MCLRLARHWQVRFNQHVIAWESSSRSLERDFRDLSRTQVSTIPSDRKTYIQRGRWVSRQIANINPDAILVHCFGVPHLITAAAARSAGIRSVSAWAGNPPPRSPIARLRFSAALMASRLVRCPVVSCSTAVAQQFRELSVGMPARSAVVPNAIDVPDIRAAAQQSRKRRIDARPTIAMVSRLDVIKDHSTLLAAFAEVRRDLSNAQLWIIGDGELRSKLQAQSHRLGVSDSTTFFGNRPDIASLLGQADVFAFSTTRDEGFGIVLIEAMAAGIPIVASDVPACREVLADGHAGLLVPPSDPGALARALCRVLGAPKLSTHIASNALQRVNTEYSIERCAQRWEARLFGLPNSLNRFAECAS